MLLCRELGLVGGETIGIDGSFFHASASDVSIETKKSPEDELKKIKRDLEAYTQCLDADDEQEKHVGDGFGEDPALASKLDEIKERQACKQAQIERPEESGETRISRTDPDARALNKGKQHVTGYNVQSSVDDQRKIIVNHEVTNAGNDRQQLSGQCQAAMEVLSVDEITAVADAGYYSETELAAGQEADATVYVPIPDKYKAVKAQGRISSERFHYNRTMDTYTCPGGELLRLRGGAREKNGVRRTRSSRPASQGQGCPLKPVCLPASGAARSLYRSEQAEMIEAHRQRMAEQGPERMRQRRQASRSLNPRITRIFTDYFLVVVNFQMIEVS